MHEAVVDKVEVEHEKEHAVGAPGEGDDEDTDPLQLRSLDRARRARPGRQQGVSPWREDAEDKADVVGVPRGNAIAKPRPERVAYGLVSV